MYRYFAVDVGDKRVGLAVSDALGITAQGLETYHRTGDDERDAAYIRRVTSGVSQHLEELDTYIERYSLDWKYGRISRIVICILRLAMFEILYMQDVPNATAINEAVGLAKRYDTPEAAAFINGILGTFVRKEVAE